MSIPKLKKIDSFPEWCFLYKIQMLCYNFYVNLVFVKAFEEAGCRDK